MSYLRTNYRISGKELDHDAIGGGVVKGAWGGGGGTNRPYGGFMGFSMVLTFQDDTATVTPSGISYYLVTSANDLMSIYYGSGQFGDGYKFWPFGARILSMSTAAITDQSYLGFIDWDVMKASDSLMMIHGLKHSTVVVSVPTSGADLVDVKGISMSTMPVRVMIWGWIVSGP